MKTTNKTADVARNLTTLIPVLEENQILDRDEMRHIRGGEGEGTGCEPIIIPPVRP